MDEFQKTVNAGFNAANEYDETVGIVEEEGGYEFYIETEFLELGDYQPIMEIKPDDSIFKISEKALELQAKHNY